MHMCGSHYCLFPVWAMLPDAHHQCLASAPHWPPTCTLTLGLSSKHGLLLEYVTHREDCRRHKRCSLAGVHCLCQALGTPTKATGTACRLLSWSRYAARPSSSGLRPCRPSCSPCQAMTATGSAFSFFTYTSVIAVLHQLDDGWLLQLLDMHKCHCNAASA